MSRNIRSTVGSCGLLRADTLYAFEPLFLLFAAGVIVGVTIQVIIVAGLVCSMVNAIWPHHTDSWLHRKTHEHLVWFTGHGGRHAIHGAHAHAM